MILRLSLIAWLSICLPLQAQDANSLLWEISGNELEKSSYLYGTMHVSKKIAFLLDDVFYQALDRSEVIALESDPATWLEADTEEQGSGYGFNPKGFYSSGFTMLPPTRKDLAAFLASDDDLVNNILYRSSDYAKDYEEETYLDMFIYQAGTKFGKPVLALEDLEESQALVGRAGMNAMKRKPDEWLQEKMERTDLMSLMQDAYRERNIALLDSIDRAMYTDHYLNNMLYIRNANMARRLDSAIRKSRVFAGIGAAHLPGDKGVIALLEKMGYTVKPLVSEATETGKQLKAKFSERYGNPELYRQAPEDGFFSILLPNKLYPVSEGQHTTYMAPDLMNGSYFIVHRIPVLSALYPDTTNTLATMESLLFENIPGSILERKTIWNEGFEGLEIRNRLKNGDHQRYQIFSTPLEILIFKMSGQQSFVSRTSDAIFNSLRLKPMQKGTTSIRSPFGDYQLRAPAYYRFANSNRTGNRRLEGFDPETGAYYFMLQATLNDFDFIEKDSFELRMIPDRFFRQLSLEPEYNPLEGLSLTASAPFDRAGGKRLFLKSALRRGDYFLLGVLSADEKDAEKYFSSFSIHDNTYSDAITSIRDTALLFTTRSPVRPRTFVESSLDRFLGREVEKTYNPFVKKTIYQHASNEAIYVSLNKSHDYTTFRTIDSVWALRKKQYTDKTFRIQREKSTSSLSGSHELELVLTDTASTRGIWIKNVVKGGLLYELKAHLDTLGRPSPFVQQFFEHFKPMDTLVGRDLMEDKTSDFFRALRENDSIVMKGYRYLLFDGRHADSLMYYLSQYDFSGDKEHIQSHLVQELGQIDRPDVRTYLERYYLKHYNNSHAQTKILQAATHRPDRHTAEELLAYLRQDLPLASNPRDIEKIFYPFHQNLALSRELFPGLLEFSGVPEYRPSVIALLAAAVSAEEIKPRQYRKYLGQLATEANLQLKRQLAAESRGRNPGGANAKIIRQDKKLLEDYCTVLFPFRDAREISPFFSRLYRVKEAGLRTTHIALLAGEGMTPDHDLLVDLAADVNSRGLLYNKLEALHKVSLFPKPLATQRYLAEAALFEGQSFTVQTDSLKFLKEAPILLDNEPYMGYYFLHRNAEDFHKNFKIYLLAYRKDGRLRTQPDYKSQGLRMADTDSEEDMIRFITEEFRLKDHPRAQVFEKVVHFSYPY